MRIDACGSRNIFHQKVGASGKVASVWYKVTTFELSKAQKSKSMVSHRLVDQPLYSYLILEVSHGLSLKRGVL